MFCCLLLVGIFEVDQEELEKKNPKDCKVFYIKKPVLSMSVAKTKNRSKKVIQKSKSSKQSSKKQKTVAKKIKRPMLFKKEQSSVKHLLKRWL